ncbi:carbohydrate ABC transporter permease [Salibacterium aidingense]|uniref:carbohydrate ABC transporter permease n=1 Tax=Salibacterium aidingense TaxID=384933 RepID=UPI000419D3C4|nr:sugar ABC transporter permease [Salibacterium aidingense]
MKDGSQQRTPIITDKHKEVIWAYVLTLPAFLILLMFHIGPALSSFWYSLTKWNGLTAPEFVGFANFMALMKDGEFLHSVWNTILFVLGAVPLQVILATIFAVLLNMGLKGTGFYRTIYFLPVVTMLIAVGSIFRWLYNSEYGLINYLLGLLHLPQPQWLTDPGLLLFSIIIAEVWHRMGYNLVILLAGLQSIPRSLYEAADIDGASIIQKFFNVTLPLLSPSLFFVIVISLINSFQVFDLIFVMVGEHPSLLNETQSIVYKIYEEGFKFYNMGYAAAQSVVLFLMIFGVTLLQLYYQKKWVHYQ